jgi:hypothetical protein
MTGSANEYVITISGCLDGNLAGLVLNALAVIDAAGNIGPSLSNQTAVTKVDTSAPKFAVFDVTAPGVGGIPSWVFDSEEPVTGMTAAKFVFSGTATGCQLNYTVLRAGLGWQITLNHCSTGTTQVTLLANSVTDDAGNLGPSTALASNQITITADEVVNQVVSPPSGNQGAAVNTTPKKQTEPAKDTSEVESEVVPTKVDQQPENLDTEVRKLPVPRVGKSDPEPVSYPYGILGLAVLLAALALKRGGRVKRRH